VKTKINPGTDSAPDHSPELPLKHGAVSDGKRQPLSACQCRAIERASALSLEIRERRECELIGLQAKQLLMKHGSASEHESSQQ
jgi:hypothetical protein